MDLKRLRQQTALQHTQTEDTVPLMREDLTLAVYADCLRRFLRVVDAWDRWADEHAPADLAALREGRRRAGLIVADLRVLGEPAPVVAGLAAMEQTVAGDTRSVFLGRMYVMEGSTLGGQYIARHAEERLGLASGEGNSFFRGYGEQTGARWREFCAVLDAVPESEAETVIESARQMFAIFSEAMQFGEAGQGVAAPSPNAPGAFGIEP